jgi:transcriptional regulator with XRE-family HTH domain
MNTRKENSNAVKILHRRYVKDDPERVASLREERINAQVAQLIHDLRTQVQLSQKELAELIGTAQSVISRLEDADYDGHSLTMLNRIATALNQRLMVTMSAADPSSGTVRYAFHLVLWNLRRDKRLTIDELSHRTEVDRDELLALERDPQSRPTPLTLHKLSEFYGVSPRRMAALAGAVREIPEDVRDRATRYAARSETFAKLTREEKKALDEFMAFLKSES